MDWSPWIILLTSTSAQYYLPLAEIFCGLFTLGTAFVTNYHQLIVMRFFVGLSASSCYVGCLHVINRYIPRNMQFYSNTNISWYRKNELGRRNALFWIAFPVGTMFAGYLQAAAYANLNLVHGMEGWRYVNGSLPKSVLIRSDGCLLYAPSLQSRSLACE